MRTEGDVSWRSASELKAVRTQLRRAYNDAPIDTKRRSPKAITLTAGQYKNVMQILEQAIHTEIGVGNE